MNIYDIAREAGVSISTVSRVINNKSRVGQKTIEKVRRVMEENNYSPSPVARGLVNKSLKTIGIVTVDIRGQHYASLAYNILEELNTLGYNCLFCNAGYTEETQERNIRMMAQNCIDGQLLSESEQRIVRLGVVNCWDVSSFLPEAVRRFYERNDYTVYQSASGDNGKF